MFVCVCVCVCVCMCVVECLFVCVCFSFQPMNQLSDIHHTQYSLYIIGGLFNATLFYFLHSTTLITPQWTSEIVRLIGISDNLFLPLEDMWQYV